MREFFIRANSFAAPFVSDESTGYAEGETPRLALESFAASYGHPCGLYAAECYASADAYHKGQPLARWLSNHARELDKAQERQIAAKGACSTLSNGPGSFEVSGEKFEIRNPKAGSVV